LNRKVAIIISLALALVFTAGIVLTANSELKKATKTVEAVQAIKYIPVGSVITGDMIEIIPVTQDLAKNLITSKEEAIGKSPAVSLVDGQLIYKDSLKNGTGKQSGFVEVYIPCDMSSSAMAVAGEQVDIHLIHKNNRETQTAPVIYKGARVLHSIDQQGKEVAPTRSTIGDTVTPNGNTPAVVGVEVPTSIAEKLVQYASQDAVYLVKSDQ